MKIHVTSVFVDDQAHALDFYVGKLGFQLKSDIPVGENRWLTVVSPDQPNGTELLLEPSDHPAVKPYRDTIVADGISATSFQVDDLANTYDQLKKNGVNFTQTPMDAGTVHMAVFDDTCGNLIQLVQIKDLQT